MVRHTGCSAVWPPVRSSCDRLRSFLPLLLGAAVLVVGLAGLPGCGGDSDDCICCPVDRDPPAAPRDLYSVTGDGWVVLYWLANTEEDLDGYRVLVSDDYYGDYELIATVDPCVDCYWESYVAEGLTNGDVYQFAVVAFDRRGNESPFSAEEIREIPRPEGFEVAISNALDAGGAQTAGFDLSARSCVAFDDPGADFWYEFDAQGGVQLLVAGSGAYWPEDSAEIQDMGWTEHFDEIGFAPPDVGWSPTATAEAILDHTYVLLTRSGNYAKIRVTAVGPASLIFDWAFQSAAWERQLITRGE